MDKLQLLVVQNSGKNILLQDTHTHTHTHVQKYNDRQADRFKVESEKVGAIDIAGVVSPLQRQLSFVHSSSSALVTEAGARDVGLFMHRKGSILLWGQKGNGVHGHYSATP